MTSFEGLLAIHVICLTSILKQYCLCCKAQCVELIQIQQSEIWEVDQKKTHLLVFLHFKAKAIFAQSFHTTLFDGNEHAIFTLQTLIDLCFFFIYYIQCITIAYMCPQHSLHDQDSLGSPTQRPFILLEALYACLELLGKSLQYDLYILFTGLERSTSKDSNQFACFLSDR